MIAKTWTYSRGIPMTRNGVSPWTRRQFLQTSAASVVGSAMANWSSPADAQDTGEPRKPSRPLIVSSANGLTRFNGTIPLDAGMKLLKDGGDPLDAVIAAVNLVEDNPDDHSV